MMPVEVPLGAWQVGHVEWIHIPKPSRVCRCRVSTMRLIRCQLACAPSAQHVDDSTCRTTTRGAALYLCDPCSGSAAASARRLWQLPHMW